MIEQSNLGGQGARTGRLGYGAMVLEGFYGSSEDSSAVLTILHALERGMMIDTADAYGNGHNEQLVSGALKEFREESLVATKFGIVFDPDESGSEVPTGWGFSLTINGKPGYAKKALESSLRRLEVDTIDLWYLHYPDPAVPIEETVGAMADAVTAGKVRYLGLSNVTAEQVRRAHQIHPISAVQYEYSLWRREAEKDLLPLLRELGIALVPWAPLGSGFLSGTIDTLEENDFRQNNPRYSGDNFQANRDRFAPLKRIARTHGVTTAQLALAWLLHQGEDIFPIPGTRKIERINENAESINVDLSKAILQEIDRIAAPGSALGATLI